MCVVFRKKITFQSTAVMEGQNFSGLRIDIYTTEDLVIE
jgi:hypothetical protein